ncbi:hypothetical protein CI102_2804 [Trichoderma harzianum]|nr:hypothetical protein CI102_2804 [Trichoderma harzianum]
MDIQLTLNPSTVNRECPFLLSLPVELLLPIASYLPIPTQISLALTCKCLMKVLFPENTLPRLSKEDRITFLSTLQKDIPGTYFCFCCHRLRRLIPDVDWNGHDHKWNIGYFKYPTWNINSGNNWHVPAPYYFSSFKDYFSVDFMDAYLVMNQHFLGSSHGLPLHILERYASFQDHIELHNCQHSSPFQGVTKEESQSPSGSDYRLYERKDDEPDRKETAWRLSFQMIPKIIHGKLYLGRFYTIVGPLMPWNCMARLISSCSPEICNHWRCLADARLVCPAQHGPMAHANSDSYISIVPRLYNMEGDFEPPKNYPEGGSCLFCDTDYEISLHQNKENKEWRFRLITYHCLGSCRSPKDKFWKSLVGNLGRRHDHSQSKAQCSCGNIKREWHEGS